MLGGAAVSALASDLHCSTCGIRLVQTDRSMAANEQWRRLLRTNNTKLVSRSPPLRLRNNDLGSVQGGGSHRYVPMQQQLDLGNIDIAVNRQRNSVVQRID